MQRNRQRQGKDSRQSSNFYLIQRHGFSLYISMKSVQNWRSSVVQLVVSAADILTVGYGNLYWEMRPQSLLMCPHMLKRAWPDAGRPEPTCQRQVREGTSGGLNRLPERPIHAQFGLNSPGLFRRPDCVGPFRDGEERVTKYYYEAVMDTGNYCSLESVIGDFWKVNNTSFF